jgi:hypothetical protein
MGEGAGGQFRRLQSRVGSLTHGSNGMSNRGAMGPRRTPPESLGLCPVRGGC